MPGGGGIAPMGGGMNGGLWRCGGPMGGGIPPGGGIGGILGSKGGRPKGAWVVEEGLSSCRKEEVVS